MSAECEPVRTGYEKLGVAGFYKSHARSYRNPHEPAIRTLIHRLVGEWNLDLKCVLDLAAGSGEITIALREMPGSDVGKIHGIDPMTFEAYEKRTGQTAGRESFEAIAVGALRGRNYSLIICSFAMHLLEPSRLPMLAMELNQISSALLILTPHKRPVIREDWGWKLTRETVQERVRARLYAAHPPRVEASCLDRE
jgi:hypothetical protein